MAYDARMKSGIKQLKKWMVRRDVDLREAAEIIGVHYTYLSKILNDRRAPGLQSALRIQHSTGIPVMAWREQNVDS
jgi:plasmid maintenance system antidote protein VapI